MSVVVNSCTREFLMYDGAMLNDIRAAHGNYTFQTYTCPGSTTEGGQEQPPQPPDKCDLKVSWNGTSFSAYCANHSEWECVAAVPLPPSYIDLRPYPVTLVRWDTALRYSGQDTSHGECLTPTAGNLKNLSITLDFKPVGWVTVDLPYLPRMTFTTPNYTPTLFKWEIPSYPGYGGGRLSGSLGGFFDEVPGDIPVFEGRMQTPYRLYYSFSFEYPGGAWSESGELLPQDVVDLPQSMYADLDKNGIPDAYWNSNFVISRMDDNNRTDNPLYERHWSYGSLLPWGVREGQGQIGWPR
jgi:hypothetical protein